LKCDVAVLFPNSFRSALTAWAARIPRRIGYDRHFRRRLLTDPLEPVRDHLGKIMPSPILDAYNVLAEHLGVPINRRMRLFTMERDEIQADKIWKRLQLNRFTEVIALNPGAAFGAAKYWPAEYFAQLARRLAVERQAGVIVLCGPSERGLAKSIVEQTRHANVASIADEALSIGLTKSLVRRCDLLVTTDSGPRHFAAAFGRPVVTLFGPTHIEWTETFHPAAIHLQKDVPCGPCQLRTCPLDHACMKNLLPDEVHSAAEKLLSGYRGIRRVG
jgi:heptosyltransferase-2